MPELRKRGGAGGDHEAESITDLVNLIGLLLPYSLPPGKGDSGVRSAFGENYLQSLWISHPFCLGSDVFLLTKHVLVLPS